ncbi:T9SS type A sorting domain-containing protein [Flavobacterium sp.]|uniref:T9SS type A sorting domain-containing protein n=1 Tax=Flavobacterium sp. TaxID=239 RepID=UPI0026244930|nr:T9SS type A sorting domain-containing protein [Flavobacterium sp.]
MKKITYLFFFFAVLQGNAQVISETFDTALNWTVSHPTGSATNAGWSQVATGSNPNCSPYAGAGMAKFASYDVAAGNVYVLTSPLFTLSSANTYKVKFSMYRDGAYPTDADKVMVYLSTSPLSNGTNLLGTVNRSISLTPVVSAEGWYNYSFNIPAGTNGNRYIRLSATSQYGNNIYFDNISVNQIVTNDAELNTVATPSVVLPGTKTISGVFANGGSNNITSATINWQINGGTINSQNLTGLNITPGQTYNYSHTTTWNATPGTYSLKVWVSNPNGVTDAFPANNEITKTVSVASNSTTRRPMYEKFTSSTCGPCASFNGSYFTPFYGTNGSNISLINYQVNWPGSGDPYYTAEVGSRRGYYSVSAAPTLFVDAVDATNSSVTGLQADYTAAAAKPAYFALSATKNLVGTTMSVNVTSTPYLDGAYKLYVAVVEKTTTGNVASNGESSFKNVMMKMMPDANGTVINCTHDVPVTTSITTNLSGTFIEDYSDLEVVVFVQNNATKEIMQSTYAIDQALATDGFSIAKINVYPNPSNGLITIDSTTAVDVTISDLTGKVVYSAKQITNQSPLNLTNLQKGIYLVKMANENGEQTEKIVLK